MRDITNNMSYLQRLQRSREEIQRLKDAAPAPQSLEDRVHAWVSGLSSADQARCWTMVELRSIVVSDTPQAIGKTLWAQGFTRKRSWKLNSPNSRMWYKK